MENKNLNNSDSRKLDEIYEMLEENNKMLSSLLFRERISNVFRIVYWLLILGSVFGVYYYFQPFFAEVFGNIEGLKNSIQSITGTANALNSAGGIQDILNMVNSVK